MLQYTHDNMHEQSESYPHVTSWFSANQKRGQNKPNQRVFYAFCKANSTTHFRFFPGQNSRHLFNEIKYFIFSSEIHQELLLHYKQKSQRGKKLLNLNCQL